jgi:hypothetical protein
VLIQVQLFMAVPEMGQIRAVPTPAAPIVNAWLWFYPADVWCHGLSTTLTLLVFCIDPTAHLHSTVPVSSKARSNPLCPQALCPQGPRARRCGPSQAKACAYHTLQPSCSSN